MARGRGMSFDCLTLGHLLSLSYVLLSRDKRPTNGHTSTPSPSFGCRSVPVSLSRVWSSHWFFPSFRLRVSCCRTLLRLVSTCTLAVSSPQPTLFHYDSASYLPPVRCFYRDRFFATTSPADRSIYHQPQAPLSCFDKTETSQPLSFLLTRNSHPTLVCVVESLVPGLKS